MVRAIVRAKVLHYLTLTVDFGGIAAAPLIEFPRKLLNLNAP
jgi:hypothetical protein